MQDNYSNVEELNTVMTQALLRLQALVNNDPTQQPDLLTTAKTFLLGVVSTSIDLIEISSPGSAPFLYADIEAAAKLGGLRAIKQAQKEAGSLHYSVSNIEPDDMETAMNYLGQELGTALFKSLHELPLPLRKPETMLRGIEALLANLLNQKFNNAHDVLDSLCEHVHMALTALEQARH